MIHFLRLFLQLRWRLAWGAFRAAREKGGFAAIGAYLAVVGTGFLSFVLVVVAAGLSVLGWLAGGAVVGEDPGRRAMALLVLRFAVGVGTAMLVLMPAVRASRGASGDAQAALTRLLLLPLSRRHLHAVEVVSNSLDPILLAFGPGLVLLAVHVLLEAPVAGGLALLSTVLFGVTFGTLAASLAFGLQIVLRNRQRAETVLLVTFVAWIGLSLIPAALERIDDRRTALQSESEAAAPAELVPAEPVLSEVELEADQERRAAERERRRRRQAETFPIWLQVLPSEAHARVVARASQGRTAAALPSLALLAAMAGGGWWLSGRLWERLVGSPATGGSGVQVDAGAVRLRELPLLGAPTSAVALTTVRTFLRTVRGKLALALTPLTVGFLGFVFGEGAQAVTDNAIVSSASERLGWFAIFMSLLALLPVSANAFASDRAGLTLQALTPIGERRLVWGKVLGGFLIYVPCLLLSLLAASLVGGGFQAHFWLSTLASGVAALAFLLPVATWMSVLLPKHADLGVLTQAGNPHQGAQWVVILCTGVVMGLVALAELGGQFLTGSPWGGVAGCVLLAGIGFGIAWPLLEAASGALEKRRESVLNAAQGR